MYLAFNFLLEKKIGISKLLGRDYTTSALRLSWLTVVWYARECKISVATGTSRVFIEVNTLFYFSLVWDN